MKESEEFVGWGGRWGGGRRMGIIGERSERHLRDDEEKNREEAEEEEEMRKAYFFFSGFSFSSRAG